MSLYFCMRFLNWDWKGSTPHRYESSKFLMKSVADGGEQPVVGPGFAWLHPEEIMKNLPLCFPGLWGPMGPRGKSFQSLPPGAGAKQRGWVCHSAVHNTLSILSPLSPRAAVSTQSKTTVPTSLRYCYLGAQGCGYKNICWEIAL